MLYVGIGKVNGRPCASPSVITSKKALLIISISACKSPYVKSTCFPPINGRCFFKSSGQVQSNVKLINGVCVPQRHGTAQLNTNVCIAFLTSEYDILSILTYGAKYVSTDENAWAPANSFCNVPKKFTMCDTAVAI